MADPAQDTTAVGLVLFPGVDIWSSLQTLAWLEGRVQGVFIYRTANAASTDSAERLRRFCSRRWPSLRVVVPGEPGLAAAARVVERLRDWRRFRPDIGRWVLDITGAEPLTVSGIATLLASEPAMEAVARGRDGAWQRFTAGPGGSLEGAPLQDPPTPHVTDELPVAGLIEAFATDVTEVHQRGSRGPESLSPEELGRLVLEGSRQNWDWSRMYAAAMARPGRLEEFTFQDFVAAALLCMSIRNVRVNLKVLVSGSKTSEVALDLVANRRGRLFVFDCRSRDEQRDPGPPSAPLTLRGLNPVCVALRPNRWATDAERHLAALSDGHILDADGCRHLFSWLGHLMDIDTPAGLRELERAVLRLGANRLPVFTPATQAQRIGDAVRVDRQVFDIVKGSRIEAGGAATAWRAARVSPDLWFLEGRVVQGGVAIEMKSRLANRFSEQKLGATILFFELTVNKKYWHALVRVAGDNAPIARFLHKWRNMPLVV